MKFICTIVVVDDIKRSRHLYEEILKQKVIADFGEFNVAFEGGLALYKRELYQNIIKPRTIMRRPNNFEIYFEENNLTEIQTIVEQNGFEIIHKIKEEPWKQLVFRFYDYDKNNICIAEDMNNTIRRLNKNKMPIDEMARVTGYKKEDIEAILKR